MRARRHWIWALYTVCSISLDPFLYLIQHFLCPQISICCEGCKSTFLFSWRWSPLFTLQLLPPFCELHLNPLTPIPCNTYFSIHYARNSVYPSTSHGDAWVARWVSMVVGIFVTDNMWLLGASWKSSQESAAGRIGKKAVAYAEKVEYVPSAPVNALQSSVR